MIITFHGCGACTPSHPCASSHDWQQLVSWTNFILRHVFDTLISHGDMCLIWSSMRRPIAGGFAAGRALISKLCHRLSTGSAYGNRAPILAFRLYSLVRTGSLERQREHTVRPALLLQFLPWHLPILFLCCLFGFVLQNYFFFFLFK